MKLTTKRNWWYFWRELFQYMIPMILIVWTVDVFVSFMRCPLHPEWSAPCNANWILAAIYWLFLLIVIVLAIISARILRKIKKKIEAEFVEVVDDNKNKKDMKEKKSKKLIARSDKKVEKKTVKKKTTKK